MPFTLKSHIRAGRLLLTTVAVLTLGFLARPAAAIIITFDEGLVAAGATLSNQYAPLGAIFSGGTGGATGVVNPPSTTQGFATTTTMTIASSAAGGDNGGSAFTAPISGLVLHSYASPNGWLGENGDAVFRIDFSTPINFFSIDFGSVSTLGASGIFAVDGNNAVIQSAFVNTAGSSTLSLTLTTPVSSIVITEGTYFDYVAVDNITFSAVPEPSTWAALLTAGAGLLGVAWRSRGRARSATA